MICIHEVIYSVCSRNFCGILSASEDFMTHDEMMSLLANTLADAAGHAGCLPILDCFSPHPGEEVTVRAEGYGGTISQHADVQAYLTLRVLRNALDGYCGGMR